MKIISSILSVLFVCLIFSTPSESYAQAGPMEQLRPTLSKLTSVLADPDLKGEKKKEERRAKIMTSIKSGFDFREMCKRILGRKWYSITPEEQKQFTRLMTKLLENVYIGKLESYSGQTIGYVDERIDGNWAQVSTLIEDENLKIPVKYVMSYDSGRWMVYDIKIEGVSLVKNYREQLSSILRTQDFSGLIEVLEKKNRSFENQAEQS